MGGSSGPERASEAASHLQMQIAEKLFNQTDPLRKGLISRSQDYLTGGIDNSPIYSGFKASAEPQYAQARDRIIATTPAGGGLTSALAGLEGDRARTLTQARGALDEAEVVRALNLATGQTGQAVSGLGQSAANFGQLGAARAERESSMWGALGGAAGAWAGGRAGNK